MKRTKEKEKKEIKKEGRRAMTILEKSSNRKCKSLKKMVEIGEYSVAYALERLENYHDEGRIIDIHYETLAEYLESLLEPVEEIENEMSPIEEDTNNFNNTSGMTFDV